MKIFKAVYIFYEMLVGADKAKALRLLRQQRKLLRNGTEGWAEAIHISILPKVVGGLRQVRLSVKLKNTDGSFIYTSTRALVSLNNIPQKGQSLRIKYFPQDLSVIMLL